MPMVLKTKQSIALLLTLSALPALSASSTEAQLPINSGDQNPVVAIAGHIQCRSETDCKLS